MTERSEDDIQARFHNKDRSFWLKGPWRRLRETRNGLNIVTVDGEWIRNNLSVDFGHGGHGMVHEFIRPDEIWVATHHYPDCGCQKDDIWQRMSEACYQTTVVHEMAEREAMLSGMGFARAHGMAQEAERVAGWMADSYDDRQRVVSKKTAPG